MAVKVGVDRVWAVIRATRAEPPGGIKGGRRKTYAASLEQAQQMFAAAETVGVATRPLLLFYGLSQGGRAIAAAAKHVDNKSYPLSGHGIKVDTSTLAGPVAKVQVYCDNTPTSSFTRLSGILGSPTWDNTAKIALGDLWNTLPEAGVFPLGDSVEAGPLTLDLTEFSSPGDGQAAPPVRLSVTGVPAAIMPLPQHTGPAPELKAFLDRYPTLAGYTAIYPMGVYPGNRGGTVHLDYQTGRTGYPERAAVRAARSFAYRLQDRYVFPAVGANTDSLHPVMAWWAVLFALSMLARYHPEAWADHIAVDHSKDAVRIEHLLTEALTAVPEQLLRTILDVSE